MLPAAPPNATVETPPRRKRRIPVSLQICAVVALIGLASSVWIGVQLYRQRMAINELSRFGAKIAGPARTPTWVEEHLPDRLRAYLVEIESVDLTCKSITDAGLAQLPRIRGLRHVDLAQTPVTDAGLAHLAEISSLQILSLNNTRTTDAGIAHLSGLTGLTSLDIGRTDISDAGLASLRGLTQLQELDLGGTSVTDAGLPHLTALPALRSLVLRSVLSDKRVSRAAITKLERDCPALQVSTYPQKRR
jgi:hypothetical protein